MKILFLLFSYFNYTKKAQQKGFKKKRLSKMC